MPKIVNPWKAIIDAEDAAPNPKGGKKLSNGRALLDSEVLMIRSSSKTIHELVKELGVNRNTIIRIRQGITYKQVK